MPSFTERRILIWGLTHPELSHRFLEAAGIYGVLEDGRPVRLNPVEFGHFAGAGRIEKYQWVRARIAKNDEDPRPESYVVEPGSIKVEAPVAPDADAGAHRMTALFQHPGWQFATLADLLAAEQRGGMSLGVVAPGAIELVEIELRSNDVPGTYADKVARLAPRVDALAQQDVRFDLMNALPPEMGPLPFPLERIRVHWLCRDPKACARPSTRCPSSTGMFRSYCAARARTRRCGWCARLSTAGRATFACSSGTSRATPRRSAS